MSDKYPGKTIIGLTGNIATGKSLVRRMLEHLGAFGIDADSLVRRAMAPGAPAYQPIVDYFGRFILMENGQIDRERLGRIVFTDPAALKKLEEITHPIVRQVLGLLIRRAKQDIVVIEAIKLIEGGLAEQCDSVWVVDSPRDVQLARLKSDRKMSDADANMRIDAQNPQKDKLERADIVIDNGTSYERTYKQVKAKLRETVSDESTLVDPDVAVKTVETKPEAGGPLSMRRAGPMQAEAIATFINSQTGSALSRMDVIKRFGQQAYMMAMQGEQVVGLIGWQVENLITRIPEFLIDKKAPLDETVQMLIEGIESASSDLQSEIVLLFLPKESPVTSEQIRKAQDYELKTIDELKVPDWREAARDTEVSDGTLLLTKRLRTDRVLKPI